MCGRERERETWQHVWESCRKWKEWEGDWSERVGWALREEGEGGRTR